MWGGLWLKTNVGVKMNAHDVNVNLARNSVHSSRGAITRHFQQLRLF